MRKIIHWVHTSIDGHIDGPEGEFGGRQLFPASRDRIGMRLAETRTFDSRTVLLRYRRAERGE